MTAPMAANQQGIELRPGVVACPGGVLWLRESRTLVIADLHLGYGWAQRRRGSLGPVADDVSPKRLEELVTSYRPEELLLLGDVVHAPRPAQGERELIEHTLRRLAQLSRVFVVLGNHDRRFVQDFATLPLHVGREWQRDGVAAVHGDRPYEGGSLLVLMGHHHPVTTFVDATGRKLRYPAFVDTGTVVVLPAFSRFAVGTDIRRLYREQPEFRALGARLRLLATTQKRVVDLGWTQLRG